MMNFKKLVVEACKEMIGEELVKGTWGNVSIRELNKIFITPSGYSYEKMTERDISVIDFEGNILEGDRNPSSEWKMHVAIYKAREDVDVILHTHPIYSSIASVAFKTVPSLIEDSAMICGPEIKVAEYADPGSWELANNVAKALEDNGAAILSNHGLVNVGKRFSEVLTGAKVTEKNVQVYIEALKLGGEISYIPEDKLPLLRKNYRENYLQ
ncbi:MAG: class II aldolase/adducin family protein [Thermotogota bacterium]|nr:class II aldolase/adducin family protein [Thermotogota bacterium]